MKNNKINNPALSIIIVTHNERKFIKRCIESVISANHIKCVYEIIIVDNNSSADFIKLLYKLLPKSLIIINRNNLGFAKACNQGWKAAKGDYIFFLNPDTIVQKSSIDNLLQFISNNSEVGAVGPLIIKPNGEIEKWQMGYERTLIRILFDKILQRVTDKTKNSLINYIAGKINLNYADHYTLRNVDWVVGAALMIRKNILVELKGFDERFFIYYEELDLQKRMKSLGWNIYHLPSAIVLHYGKSSHSEHYMKSSRLKYLIKYNPIFSKLIVFLNS